MRGEQAGGQLLADQEFDFGRSQRRSDGVLVLRLDRVLALLFVLGLGGGAAVLAQWDGIADAGHHHGQPDEGQEGKSGQESQNRQQQGRDLEGARIGGELAEHGLVGGPARAALGDQKAGGQRDDQRRNLGHQAVADRQLDEHVGGLAKIHVVAAIADRHAADDVDPSDDQAGDRVAADEFRGAVHGAEKRAFLLELAPACLGFLVVDHAGGKVGVDRHLLAGDGVEGEAGADLGDAGGALGDDDEVHHDQDQEHDQPDDEIARHDQVGKAADHVAGRVGALVAVSEDDACGGDVERQPQHGGDQQDRREGRKIERPLDPQRHHQDQDRDGDRERQPDIDHEGGDRQEQDRQDGDDADREEDVAAVAGGGRRDGRVCGRACRHVCLQSPSLI